MNGRVPPGPARPDRSHSRFFCNTARKVSLVFGIIAVAALVIGGGFSEISSNGAPTPLETAIVWRKDDPSPTNRAFREATRQAFAEDPTHGVTQPIAPTATG